MTNLDSIKRILEKRISRLQSVLEMLESDPDLFKEIAAEMLHGSTKTKEIPPNREPRRIKTRPGRTTSDDNFKHVVEAFRKLHNEWTDAATLERESGLKRRHLLYVVRSSHKSRFEKRKHPDGGNRVQWRLPPG